jgi:hypothetical protein
MSERRFSSVMNTLAVAAALSAISSASGFGESDHTGPGKSSKGIVRNRVPVEPNEYTTRKKQSASLKRLLRK